MANTFKSAMVDITSTDLTTILTVPTANPGATPPVPPTTDVVKSILICIRSSTSSSIIFKIKELFSLIIGYFLSELFQIKLLIE